MNQSWREREKEIIKTYWIDDKSNNRSNKVMKEVIKTFYVIMNHGSLPVNIMIKSDGGGA